MRLAQILLTLVVLVPLILLNSCTTTSAPDPLSDFAIHTEYNPVIIPYYMFDYEGLEIPPSGTAYHILNSAQDAYAMPKSDIFVYLQKEIYNNFDFSKSSIVLISVLGEIEGPAPHCSISFSYNDDKSSNIVTINWKEGIEPIEDITNLDKEKAAIIQFAIGVGKLSSDTPIIIQQEFS